jgi:hypothetical protein
MCPDCLDKWPVEPPLGTLYWFVGCSGYKKEHIWRPASADMLTFSLLLHVPSPFGPS